MGDTLRTRPAGAILNARYRVLGSIFAGRASEVLEAEDEQGNVRAIKIARATLPDAPGEARRLVREGCILTVIEHPSLVRVFEIGVTRSGSPYIVMERLAGETLRARLNRQGKLSPAEALGVARRALLGLHSAHRAGVVHRDVKPSNIFLSRDAALPHSERPVVLDFGLAKLGGAGIDTTVTEAIVGTPSHLAPEQILGGRVDARTDVYSMGIVLFQSIAGRLPFHAVTELESMRAHIYDKPLPLGALADVSPELEEAVMRALEKSPDDRWPSAAAFAAALSPARPINEPTRAALAADAAETAVPEAAVADAPVADAADAAVADTAAIEGSDAR